MQSCVHKIKPFNYILRACNQVLYFIICLHKRNNAITSNDDFCTKSVKEN